MTFQQLTQAILADMFPGTIAYPLGQADGGRDATHNRALTLPVNSRPGPTMLSSSPEEPLSGAARSAKTIFQVKFSTKPESVRDPVTWLVDAFKSEESNLHRLHTSGSAKKYYLVTNLPGTGAAGVGQMDRVEAALAELNGRYRGLEISVWWRDTLDRHLESAWSLWWTYPQILDGPKALALVLRTLDGKHAERRDRALRVFLADQARASRHLRFKQAELDNVALDQLFIDVPARPAQMGWAADSTAWRQMSNAARTADLANGSDWRREDSDEDAGERAASMLLGHESVSRVVVIGAPGQGKSTLLQMVCQTHRARLGVDEHEGRLIEMFPWGPARVPIEVDLKSYAEFRRTQRKHGEPSTLEAYLAGVVATSSGGTNFDVDDLQEVLTRVPMLFALDALDEVADSIERNEVAEEIEAAGSRLSEISKDLTILLTSRPKDAVGNPIVDASVYLHLVLSPLPLALADDYVTKWVGARGFDSIEAARIAKNWNDHRADSHVRDLTTNLMQVSIVLYIFHRRGESVPRNRTALYAEYVRLLFDREADKDVRVASLRSDLEELHGYLALLLHCRAEQDNASGSLDLGSLENAIAAFANATGRDSDLISLFAGVQRVAALVSRVPGRFEFEVQPLREYFAGTYLYQSAPVAPPWADQPAGQRHDRVLAMLERTYWHNALRFFAGNYTSGEIGSLADVLAASTARCGPSVGPNARSVALQLLADRVFASHHSVRQRVVSWAFSEEGCRLLEGNGRVGSVKLGEETGLLEMIDEVFSEQRLGNVDDLSRGDLARLLAVSAAPEAALPRAVLAIEKLPASLHLTALALASNGGLLRALTKGHLESLEDLAGHSQIATPDWARMLADGDAPLWFEAELATEAVVHALRNPSSSTDFGPTIYSEAQAVVDCVGFAPRARRLSNPLSQANVSGLTPRLAAAQQCRGKVDQLEYVESLAGADAWLGRSLCAYIGRYEPGDSPARKFILASYALEMGRRRRNTEYWEALLDSPTSEDGDLHQAWWCLCVLACAGDTALLNLMHPLAHVFDALSPDRQELVASSLNNFPDLVRIDSGPYNPQWPESPSAAVLLRSRFQTRWATDLSNLAVNRVLAGSSVSSSSTVRGKIAGLLWTSRSNSYKESIAAIGNLGVDLAWVPPAASRSFEANQDVIDAIIENPRSWPPGLISLAVGNEQSRGRDSLLALAKNQGWTNFSL